MTRATEAPTMLSAPISLHDTAATGAVALDTHGERLWMLPDRTVWWPAARTLFVADAHFGKGATFRARGLPVPGGTTADNLARLGRAVAARGVARLVFLGDFLHAREAQHPALLQALHAWRAAHAAVAMTLVRGNHDSHAGDPPPSLGIDIVDEPLAIGPIAACHHPQQRAGALVLAGHWHPSVTLGGGGAHDHLRLPCFWHEPGLLVLPAFGAFTGLGPIASDAAGCAYAVADGRVWPLGARAAPGVRR